MFRNLVLSAAAAGLAAGLLTAALQHVTTTPIILAAEQYEAPVQGAQTHSHAAHGTASAAPHVHDHAASWSPADGIERTVYTSLSTAVMGVGFGLVLLGAMVVAGVRIDGRTGLAFGAAGFAAVALAPALGLPPELPGSGAAPFEARQAWWLLTAAATAAGLAALLLGRRIAVQLAGAVLVAVPHLIGAPDQYAFVSTAPAELAGRFAAASLVVTAIFWAVLGALSGAFYKRIAGTG